MEYHLFAFVSCLSDGSYEQNFQVVCAENSSAALKVFRRKYPWPVQVSFTAKFYSLPEPGEISTAGFQTFKTNPFK